MSRNEARRLRDAVLVVRPMLEGRALVVESRPRRSPAVFEIRILKPDAPDVVLESPRAVTAWLAGMG